MLPENRNDEVFGGEPAGNYPLLSKISRENPFRVPADYFDMLPEEILKRIDSIPDFESSGENPFRVPEGYFDSLPTVIQHRITEQNKKRSRIPGWASLLLRPRLSLALAALIILLVFGIRYFTRTTTIVAQENSVSSEEIQNSICFSDLDESVMIDALEQQPNKNMNTKDDNSLEQYLIDNDVDISQLENHL